MANLAEEIIETLKENNKKIDDVLYCTDGKNKITIYELLELTINMFYDAGYGGPEINQRLAIIGKGWWLERREYGGSEWFTFRELYNTNKYNTLDKNEIHKFILKED